jgi:methyl-accepting chemotaxis protein
LKPGDVIQKSLPRYLLLFATGIFIIFTVLSAAYLYLDIYRPLSTHYSAIVSILADMHETLAVKTLKINAVFFIMILAGTLILGVLYTHRIVGPLYRIKMGSKAVLEGKLRTRLTFRKKDAIQSFGDSFNKMTKNYCNKIRGINAEVDQLNKTLTDLKIRIENGEAVEAELKKALETDAKIRELLSDIKL